MKSATCIVACIAATAGLVSVFSDVVAADRAVTTAHKSRPTSGELTDGLEMATRPKEFRGKAVSVYCDILRNPDTSFITCRAGAISIVVDTRYMRADTLRYAFEHCQGMMSTCRGTVSGVAEFFRGVPTIVQADLELADLELQVR
jgi:hypothetical protein